MKSGIIALTVQDAPKYILKIMEEGNCSTEIFFFLGEDVEQQMTWGKNLQGVFPLFLALFKQKEDQKKSCVATFSLK